MGADKGMRDVSDFVVTGEKDFRLEDFPTTLKVDAEERPAYEARLERNKARIEELQDRLYAEARESLIVILQAMDAAGKDSTIRHVLGGINPTGIDVRSFKQPTSVDRAHGFLWRSFSALPERGKIAVFNRSYYEECLVVRVHGLWRDYQLPRRCTDMSEKRYFEERYEDIRGFERYLWRTGNRVVKIFLNVSADKQRALPRAYRRRGQELEVLRERPRRAHGVGRVPARLRGDGQRHRHPASALARHPRGPEAGRAHAGVRGAAPGAGGHGPALP